MYVYYIYVIVITQCLGYYGCKQPESEDKGCLLAILNTILGNWPPGDFRAGGWNSIQRCPHSSGVEIK